MEEVNNEDLVRLWSKKLAPPLVTLLSAEPEVQYVALRNINLIVQRWPQILSHEVKVSAHRQGAFHSSFLCAVLACGRTSVMRTHKVQQPVLLGHVGCRTCR